MREKQPRKAKANRAVGLPRTETPFFSLPFFAPPPWVSYRSIYTLYLVELKHVEGDLEGVLPRVTVDDLEELVDASGGQAGVGGGAIDPIGKGREGDSGEKGQQKGERMR